MEKARVISAVQSQSRLFHSRWKGYQNYWHCSYYLWMQIHSSLEKILHTDRSDSITAYVSYQIKWGYFSLLDIITCWASANHIHYLGCEEAKTQRKKHLKLNVLFFFLSCLIKLLLFKKFVYLLKTFNTLLFFNWMWKFWNSWFSWSFGVMLSARCLFIYFEGFH